MSPRYIKAAAIILRDTHGSDIPDTIAGLTALPGVGPKMAHLCLSAAWGRTEGIGVDVHVHRITNMWGWHKTTNPEATRLALESWLPRDRWREINTLLVGLGQTVCPPQAGSKRCGECDLGLRGLCAGADRRKVAAGRVKREEDVKEEVEDEDEETQVVESGEGSRSGTEPDIKIEPGTARFKLEDSPGPLPAAAAATPIKEEHSPDAVPLRLRANGTASSPIKDESKSPKVERLHSETDVKIKLERIDLRHAPATAVKAEGDDDEIKVKEEE